MCFGSKQKTVVAPPPTPPTTFDYSSANRGTDPQQKQAAVASTEPSTMASFGSELSSTGGK